MDNIESSVSASEQDFMHAHPDYKYAIYSSPKSDAKIIEIEFDLHHIPNSNYVELPNDLDKLKFIELITIHGQGDLLQFPNSFTFLSKLEKIIINNCLIQEITENVERLINLTSIIFKYCRELVIPLWISRLPRLRELFFEGEIPLSWHLASCVQKIAVYNLIHPSLPNSLCRVAHLKELYLSHNRLDTIPEWIGFFHELEIFAVCDNRLTNLPETIGQLENLKKLNLSGNNLTHLPEIIGNLKDLRIVDLSYNTIELIPDSFEKLTALEELLCDYSPLTNLPTHLDYCRNLRILSLNYTQISQIPDIVFSLLNLEELNLAGNHLTEIPQKIQSLSKLKRINLGNNRLTNIPSALAFLPQLESLNLAINPIREISLVQDSFHQLKYLYLWKCQISQISPAIIQLESLNGLYLGWNPLNSNSLTEITQLHNLHELFLNNCNLQNSFNISVIAAAIQSVRIYDIWEVPLEDIALNYVPDQEWTDIRDDID